MVWPWIKRNMEFIWFGAMMVGIHISWLELNKDPDLFTDEERQKHPHPFMRYFQEWTEERKKKAENEGEVK